MQTNHKLPWAATRAALTCTRWAFCLQATPQYRCLWCPGVKPFPQTGQVTSSGIHFGLARFLSALSFGGGSLSSQTPQATIRSAVHPLAVRNRGTIFEESVAGPTVGAGEGLFLIDLVVD